MNIEDWHIKMYYTTSKQAYLKCICSIVTINYYQQVTTACIIVT